MAYWEFQGVRTLRLSIIRDAITGAVSCGGKRLKQLEHSTSTNIQVESTRYLQRTAMSSSLHHHIATSITPHRR